MSRSTAQEPAGRLNAERAADGPFAAAIKAAQMAMLITDAMREDNPIIFCNRAFTELTGYREDEVVGRNCRFLQGPETDPAAVQRIREAVRAGDPVRVDILNYRKDGSPFWNALFISPVRNAQGQVTNFFASQIDMSGAKGKEMELAAARDELEREVPKRTAELQSALDAKTVLLHEVDHRVKNNLLMIASIVKLQARRSTDPVVRKTLHSVLQRVEALSTVQRKLFTSDDVSRFDVAEFTRDLVADLVGGVEHKDIDVRLDLSPVMVAASKASPLALIVNELVTDAVSHHDRRGGGQITATVKRYDGAVMIRIEDDGVGLPGEELGPGSFGRLIVETCARQLSATVRWDAGDYGTLVEVTLPEGEPTTAVDLAR